MNIRTGLITEHGSRVPKGDGVGDGEEEDEEHFGLLSEGFSAVGTARAHEWLQQRGHHDPL